MAAKVRFYRDKSPDSKDVEAGLQERGIDYKTKWADSSDGLLPAIEVGRQLFEGAVAIEFYFFNTLDKGGSIEGVEHPIPSQNGD